MVKIRSVRNDRDRLPMLIEVVWLYIGVFRTPATQIDSLAA
jgi:hypothetical protein